MLKIYSLFILLWIIPQIACQTWGSPYFIASDHENVLLDSFVGTTQLIFAHEEIPVPFHIAIINYSGDTPPILNGFIRGSNAELGIEIQRRTDNRYDVVVKNLQDFEKISETTYQFNIRISTVEMAIQLVIVNFVDTAPTIEYDAPCTIQELLPADTDTGCIFTVSVDDGFSSTNKINPFDNAVTPVVFDDEELKELFEFTYKTTINDQKLMTYSLKLKKTLRYEQKAFYNFRSYFQNSKHMQNSVLTIVELIDMPSMPPTWVQPFTIQTFDEKEAWSYIVSATDGDTGIDDDIQFRIEFADDVREEYETLILIEPTLNKNEAKVVVPGIDRDELQKEIFRFKIVAFKMNGAIPLETYSDALIVINDKNDKYPEISVLDDKNDEVDIVEIRIPEEKLLTLPIHKLVVHDRDLEKNAMYSVELGHSDGGTAYSLPFTIIPANGYQRSDFFKINIIENEYLLDFEDAAWQNFEISIISRETDTDDVQSRTKIIKIILENWNDEIPIFEEIEYTIDVLESVGADFFILKVFAKDADIGDEVIHSILGNLGELLAIDELNGDIKTKDVDTFDYEKQTQVILQVMAADTLVTGTIGEVLHKVYAQVTINVIDVNDETPEIKMVDVTPEIEENVPANYIVTKGIRAFDPDTNADLRFTIDWGASSAIKSGRTVDEEHYHDCFIIERDIETINIVWGHLKVNPLFVEPEDVDIDYEKFEVLYLTIIVQDMNQEIGEPTATMELTIRLIDLNDNAPQFIAPTLLTVRNVLEEAIENTQIGTILAEDIDGPEFNEIIYSIRPQDGSGIPDDWIEIDDKGVIWVKADKAIDCDEPPREDLDYVITIADTDFITTGSIKIHIIDTNNKIPEVPTFENSIDIKEKITDNGTVLTTIIATDADRDEPHRHFQFLIDPSYIYAGSYFDIERETGILSVRLIGNAEFNYDTGMQIFEIPIEVYDGTTIIAKRTTTSFTVNLIDVNDNKPIFNAGFNPSVAENSPVNTDLTQELCATDLDSGANGEIDFEIISIVPADGGEELDLFDITPGAKNCIKFYVKSSLKGYYGTWAVTIKATDRGIDDLDFGPQHEIETFNVEITPYNFNNPRIIYPTIESMRLNEDQEIDEVLNDVNNDPLKSFEAVDDDGGVFGIVEFIVTPTVGQDETDAEFFTFEKLDDKTADLKLTKKNTKSVYYITCTAYDGGSLPSISLNMKITFVNINRMPYFESPEDFTFFREQEAGESYIIPEGIDPLNEGLDEEDYINNYYFLESEDFQLDRVTRELTLIKPLDRSEQERHVLKIILSRIEENQPANPADDSILTLTILVIKADAPPIDPSKPTIFYPFSNTLRLIKDQIVDADLIVVGNTVLRSFEAFGRNIAQSLSIIKFTVSNVPGELEDADYFMFETVDKTLSNLRLAKEIDIELHPNPYNIRIIAEDSVGQQSESFDLKITFVDTSRLPYFVDTTGFIHIPENDTGLATDYPIPEEAIEPLNEGLESSEPDFKNVYYFIDSTYNNVDARKFAISPDSGKLSLTEMLNREAQGTHEIRLIVSRDPSEAPTSPPIDSMLLLTVIVLDINDNPPVFESDINGAGITTSDRPPKVILTLRAIDLDLNETLTYAMDENSFQAIGDGIDAVEHTSFGITSENNLGHINLNFIPRANMVGHFEFIVKVSDNDNKHSDTALVKIYLIADANRVTFVFLNSVDELELYDNMIFMTNLFMERFGYECSIEEIVPATDENGVIIENLTNVRVIFIKDNEAIPAETIQAIASDVVFITQLKSQLAQQRLILQEVPTGATLSDETNKAELLQTILIVLSVVLGILCAVLIIAFFIRTRNLRRQLKAMSTVDFGSTSSNLNRREAPTTNVFSVEGSNPVLNNNNIKPVFDNVSVHSDESDFNGIHNDPTFQHRRESINPGLIEEIRRKSINPMVNGKSNGFDSNL